MSMPAGLVAATLLLTGCTYGPVTNQSGFESAVLGDGQSVVVAYHVLRYRPATGLAAFPDGGTPRYLEDRIVIALASISGGEPRVLQRLETRGLRGSASVGLRAQAADPDHALVIYSQQASTSQPSRSQRWRLSLNDAAVLPYPDLEMALAREGRTFGAAAFGDVRVLDPDGSLLIGAKGPEGEELWTWRPGGTMQKLDGLKQFYGVRGDEVGYWVGHESRVRNWRTGAVRVVARYDPVTLATTTAMPHDPMANAATWNGPEATRSVQVSADHSAVALGVRTAEGTWTYSSIPLDVGPLRR